MKRAISPLHCYHLPIDLHHRADHDDALWLVQKTFIFQDNTYYGCSWRTERSCNDRIVIPLLYAHVGDAPRMACLDITAV